MQIILLHHKNKIYNHVHQHVVMRKHNNGHITAGFRFFTINEVGFETMKIKNVMRYIKENGYVEDAEVS